MKSAGRHSGKSFRKILTALIAASEGKNVLYLSENRTRARYYLESAKRVGLSYVSSDFINEDKNRSILIFGKDERLGTIRFFDRQDGERTIGLKFDLIIEDD